MDRTSDADDTPARPADRLARAVAIMFSTPDQPECMKEGIISIYAEECDSQGAHADCPEPRIDVSTDQGDAQSGVADVNRRQGDAAGSHRVRLR